jgi:hypothetical protein
MSTNATTAITLKVVKVRNSIARWSSVNDKLISEKYSDMERASNPPIGNRYQKKRGASYFFQIKIPARNKHRYINGAIIV